MVLLTSSSISVAISSSIVCIFTFLLFMSGYVLQQQTVRSLQEALHAPPVPKPTPTLPPQFQKPAVEDLDSIVQVAPVVTEQVDSQLESLNADPVGGESIETAIETPSNLRPAEEAAIGLSDTASYSSPDKSPTRMKDAEATPSDGVGASITSELSDTAIPNPESPSELSDPSASALPLRLAYVLTVTQPSQICSALLFFRQHSQSQNTDHFNTATAYLLLYPSRWETDPSHEAYTAALSLMRTAQDSLDIIYHPVRTTEAWSGLESASTQSQLLGELQRYHWAFDRVLYLKTPGLANDVAALDTALSSTSGSLRRNWVLLSKLSAASREANDPPIMLLSEKGILVPRGELRGRLTVSGATDYDVDRHISEMDVEATSKSAAYVYFSQEELDYRHEEKEWYGGVFERYERAVNEVCKGSIFDREKGELRR
jgi:hypothetical protein